MTNDFGASEATADDMRNKLMKIPKCMLVIVLTLPCHRIPVLDVSILVDLLNILRRVSND